MKNRDDSIQPLCTVGENHRKSKTDKVKLKSNSKFKVHGQLW